MHQMQRGKGSVAILRDHLQVVMQDAMFEPPPVLPFASFQDDDDAF